MAIEIGLTITDVKGDKSTVTIPLPDGTALSDVQLFATQLAALVQPLVQGQLVSLTFTVPVNWTPWPIIDAAADVQEKARFAFRTASGFLKSLSIPTVVESIFATGSGDVDTSDPDVAAFVTAMEDGIDLTGVGGSGTIEPSDLRNDDLVSLAQAHEAWGRYRG